VLTCFCDELLQTAGEKASQLEFVTSKETKVKTCGEIFVDRSSVDALTSSVALLIVAMNFFLREIVTRLVASLRLKTVTKETETTMVAIFLAQFVNTAVLLVLCNAFFADVANEVGPLSLLFQIGTETDFGVRWYKLVGT
jgi:hypothetical protein